mmetsp:Transcript_18225/g.42433  ORF Transcript_18225/g.42433 Transcript_18225/m.42433 type:complete len:178 (-) Transcript_18225:1294-1827(-)
MVHFIPLLPESLCKVRSYICLPCLKLGPGFIEECPQCVARYLLCDRQVIFSLVLLCILQHSFYLLRAQSALLIGNLDLGLGPLVCIFSRHFQYPVGINIESHSDLWYPTWCLWYPRKSEVPQTMVVFHQRPLTLVDSDGNLLLVVFCRTEVLAASAGHCRVPGDDDLHVATHSLYPQ